MANTLPNPAMALSGKQDTSYTSVDVFLELTGQKSGLVKGESIDATHMGQIDIKSWSFGAKSPSDAATGLASGRRAWEMVKITKATDSASCAMMSMLSANENIKTFVIRARKSGGKNPVDFVKMTLVDANARSFRVMHGDSSGQSSGLIEEWTFSFRKITVDYTPQGEDGQKRGGMSFTDDWGAPGQ